jgi:pimeloyl-ACP methyl ester carboxylesterase
MREGNMKALASILGTALVVVFTLVTSANAEQKAQYTCNPIVIHEQGSFFVGGRTVSVPGTFDPTKFHTWDATGQSFPVDHLLARYQIPPNARELPLVMVHGRGQFGKSWETTPDGREGFATIFVRRGFSVYVVDFPRRAGAGIPSFKGGLGKLAGKQYISAKTTRFSNEESFPLFRLGPKIGDFFPGVQFSRDPAALEQFFRQNIANVDDDPEVISDALAAVLNRIGPAVLITHSQSGKFGWMTAMKSDNVRGIVSYEPGPPKGLPFPPGEVPPPRKLYNGMALTHAFEVPLEDFRKLTRFPIQIVNGDFFPTEPLENLYLDFWRVRNMDVKDFVKAVIRHGGHAELLDLPEIGIKGNTHFPMSDLNSLEVADQLSKFLKDKALDRRH